MWLSNGMPLYSYMDRQNVHLFIFEKTSYLRKQIFCRLFPLIAAQKQIHLPSFPIIFPQLFRRGPAPAAAYLFHYIISAQTFIPPNEKLYKTCDNLTDHSKKHLPLPGADALRANHISLQKKRINPNVSSIYAVLIPGF